MTTNMTGHVTGIDKLIGDLSSLSTAALPAVGMAMHEEGEAIMTKAKQIVPRKSSALAGTGFVDPPIMTPLGVTVRLHFGGGVAKDYAVIQHENIMYHHPLGGRFKYLENPFLLAFPGMAERIALRAGALIL